MITCDIGMSSSKEIQYAKNNNLKTIITDHHKAIDTIPKPNIIINPWLEENSNLFFKEYSGSGVAFKLCHAINEKLDKADTEFISDMIRDHLADMEVSPCSFSYEIHVTYEEDENETK